MNYLYEKLKQYYSDDLIEEIIKGMNKRHTTFRINTLKSNEEVLKELDLNNINYIKSNLYENAYILKDKNEKSLEELSCYKEGKIYLQSLSSMMPALCMTLKENSTILDMASAPGGKTTLMAQLSNNKCQITACEVNKLRCERLKYNVSLQGATSVYVMNQDGRFLDSFFSFDEILLDAPCSGSGTRFNTIKSLEGLTDILVNKSIKSQTALLKKAYDILKKNGTILYSTCSIFKDENENVVLSTLKGKNYEVIPLSFSANDIKYLPSTIKGALTIMPTGLYEGFFMIKIKKLDN